MVDTDPPFVHGEAGERAAQIINVELGKGMNVIAICAALCAISIPISLWAGYQAQVMTTEYRVEINHRMEMEAQQRVMQNELEALKHGNR